MRNNISVPEIHETMLPGIGIRYEFVTSSGIRIGVISHHSGDKELLVYDEDDPDSCTEVMRIDANDARALAEVLGGSQVVEKLTNLQQKVEGLTIDWLQIKESSAVVGRSIGSLELRSKVGVTIVALIHNGESTAVPLPSVELHAGDTAVMVGKPDAIRNALKILQNG